MQNITESVRHIGLIAGDKKLPAVVVDWARRNGKKISVVGIDGCVEPSIRFLVDVGNYRQLYISELSKAVSFFKSAGVDTVVIVGGVGGAKFKFTVDLIRVGLRLLFIKNKYDGVLRLVIGAFEKSGLSVCGIQDLIPEMLIEKKVLTDVMPSAKDIENGKFGFFCAKDFAKTDKGQSIVVFDRRVIATEKFKGTDDLIRRASVVKRGVHGGVLVKVAKPCQDLRADIPVLGVNTIMELNRGQFSGVFIEAGKAIIENREQVIRLANELGIFVMGVDGDFDFAV